MFDSPSGPYASAYPPLFHDIEHRLCLIPSRDHSILNFPAPDSPRPCAGFPSEDFTAKSVNANDLTQTSNRVITHPSIRSRPKSLSPAKTRMTTSVNVLPETGHLHLMLKLSSLYFSMIAKLVDKVEQPYKESACTDESHPVTTRYHHDHCLPFPDEWTTANVGPALVRSKDSRGSFIDSLLRSWTMPNLVSGLLFLSMVFFVVYILALVRRSGSTADPSTVSPLSPNAAIGLSFLGPSLLWRNRDFGVIEIAEMLQGYRRGGEGEGYLKPTPCEDNGHKSELGPAPRITTTTAIVINGVIFVGGPAGYWVAWVRWNGESLQERGCAGDVVHDVVYEERLECGGRTEHLDGAAGV
ncbi:hypothetical protein BKA82DRAFT_31181 [Pisolithus tinctorius]|uniref:Uncharacterized protein n=1 Tax=Pisolithus tinctorius Marx 270 TaxID=870435 RepID=A0A0C3NT98_PISTI|nr:hypothetical protein BKA82DRAFT_31181 [Pisolithus tinctorius]KIN98700.1 hypothetical protein M404DRAFT_31181 [Pisolithus tinctorius Marx 270]